MLAALGLTVACPVCHSRIALPTLVAGLYGMNFEHMPELKWAFGYPVALAGMTIVDVYLFCRFRKAGWL